MKMDFEKILKYVVLGGLFLVTLIPLFVANSLFFPFITGKAFAFRILIEIVFVAWLILVLLNKDYLPRSSKILWSFLVFVFVITLADIFGFNPYVSFWSNFERMEGLVSLLHLGAFFVVIGSVFNRKNWDVFFKVSLGVSLIICFYSLLQIMDVITINQGGVRVDGTLGNAIYLAVYLMFHAFLSTFYFFKSEGFKKWFYLGLTVFELIILYFTASRGVVLGLVAGAIVSASLIALFEKDRKTLRRTAGLVLLTIFILIAGFFVIKDTQFVRNNETLARFSDTSFEKFKTEGRYFIWPMAVEGIKDRPILGYGHEGFQFVFDGKYNPDLYGHEPWFDRSHNIYLDWMIVGGILGLTSFLSIFLLTFWKLRKTNNFSVIEKNILAGLLVAYLFQGIFIFDNLTSYILLFSVIAFIWSQSAEDSKIGYNLISKFNNKNLKLAYSVTSLVLLVIFIYILNVKPLLANKNLLFAIHPNNSPEVRLDYFKKVFESDTFGSTEALYQLMRASMTLGSNPNVPNEIKSEYLALSEENIRKLTQKFSEAKLFLNSGSFYNSINRPDEALKYLEKAKEFSPTRQDIYLEIGISYFSLGQTQKAIDNFNYAIELQPNNSEGNVRAAITLLYSGNQEEAERFLAKIDESTYYSDNRILNAFAAGKQYDKVLEIWQKRVESNPSNISTRQSLVGAYILIGHLEKAIEELNTIINLEPSFKESGEYAIKEIRAGRGRQLVQ